MANDFDITNKINKARENVRKGANVLLEETKLTDWNNEPTLNDLRTDYDGSRPYHDDFVNRIKYWNDAKNIENEFKPVEIEGKSKVQPKTIRKQAEWKYPSFKEPFLENDKIFNIAPRSWADIEAAKQEELIINYQFDEIIDKVSFIDELVNTAGDDGTAIVKVSWDRQTEIEQIEKPIYELYTIDPNEQEKLQYIQQAIQIKQQDPQQYLDLPEDLKESVEATIQNNAPTEAVQVDTKLVDDEKIICNKPILQVIDPNRFYIDPTCENNLNNAKFIIISFITSKAELEQAGIYKNLDLVNFKAGAYNRPDNERILTHNTQYKENFTFADTARKQVTAFEYWGYYDIEGDGKKLTPIVATWIDNVLIRLEESPYPDGKYPFVAIPYMPLRKEIFGEPDASLIADNQKIIGAITRANIDLMGKSANGQIGVAADFLDPGNFKKFIDGEDYRFNTDFKPSDSIYTHTFPELSQSSISMLTMQSNEVETMTGQQAFGDGLSSSSYGQVAAGIKGVITSVAKREMSILRRFANGLKKIAEKIIALNTVFLTEEDVIRITDNQFININPANLKGNFDLKVDISTIEMDNQKASDLLFLLQTVGNNFPFDVSKDIFIEIARLKKLPILQHKLENYAPQPDPIAQKQQELQVALLQAQINKLNAQAQNETNKAQSINPELEQANAQSEALLKQAKARSLGSEADMNDLDYVEQETGTKHLRDMDKINAQAEANQNYEVTKELAKNPELPPDQRIQSAVGYNLISKKLNRDSSMGQPEAIQPTNNPNINTNQFASQNVPNYNQNNLLNNQGTRVSGTPIINSNNNRDIRLPSQRSL